MAAPLVYSEATYTQPILAGNNSEIKMSINTVSDHSVTFYFEIFQNGKSCSIVKTSHVFISKLNKKKIKVPENFLKIFNSQN